MNKTLLELSLNKKFKKLRAIQGELSRTISSIDGITSTRVHIVVPKSSLFVTEKKEPTASIYLRTKRGFELDKKQIRGIQNLVSKAVEGLTTNNIAILSASGQLLTEVESNNEVTQQTDELLQFKKQIERSLEERESNRWKNCWA